MPTSHTTLCILNWEDNQLSLSLVLVVCPVPTATLMDLVLDAVYSDAVDLVIEALINHVLVFDELLVVSFVLISDLQLLPI